MSLRAATALALTLFVLVSCRGEEHRAPEAPAPDEAIPIEDVALPVDADLSTEGDSKGTRVVAEGAGVSGFFPGDFPRDLPMHEPASIVDFGSGSGGWSYVELDSASAREVVVADLDERLARAGWSITESDRDGFRAMRSGVVVRISLTESGAGTRIRVEYR